MTFQQAISSGLSNYVNFSGRATRSAFWYWVLFAVIVSIVAGIIDAVLFSGVTLVPRPAATPVNPITGILLFLPGLGVSVRRLHDVDCSGWWLLIALTIIGFFLLLYWYCKSGT